MNLKSLSKLVPAFYETRRPIHLVGRPGMGKSDFARSVVDSLSAQYGEKFGLVEVLLSQREPSDLHGIPVPTKNASGELVTVFTRSDIYEAITSTGCARGILLMEERNQSPQMVQNASCRILLDRMVGRDKLPDGWYIISTSNRSKDRAGVNKPPTQSINREFTFELKPDMDGWCEWAAEHGIDYRMIAFARWKPGVVFENDSPPDGPFMTPRSLVFCNDFLTNYARILGTPNTLPTDSLALEACAGAVGEASAAELFAFLRVQTELETIDNIVADPMKAKLPPAGRMDVTYATVEMCVQHATAKNVNPVFTYVTRLAKEFQTMAARQIIAKSKDGVLLNSKVMTDWITENKALVIASIA